MDIFSLKQLAAAHAPYAISPIPGPKTPDPTSWKTKLFGVRSVSDLGLLTTSPGARVDAAIVHRSWGLLGGEKLYGPNFYFSEFMKARNYLTGILFHFAVIVGTILLAIRPLRQLATKFVFKPGEGPTKEQVKNDRVEYRGIGIPDMPTGKKTSTRAFCKASYEGSLYACGCLPPRSRRDADLIQLLESYWQKLRYRY
jgi:hypothetical protein